MSNTRLKLGNNLFSSILKASKRRKRHKYYTIRNLVILKNYFNRYINIYNSKLNKQSKLFINNIESFLKKVKQTKVSVRRSVFFDDHVLENIIDNNKEKSFSLKEIQEKYCEITNSNKCSISTLKRYLVNILGYRFKKTLMFNEKAVDDLYVDKELTFFTKMKEVMKKEVMLLYLDESSFCEKRNTIKIWVKKNTNKKIANGGRIKSVSIMATISKDGVIYYELTKEKFKSVNFISYINNLEGYFRNNEKYKRYLEERRIYIILDNAKLHTSKYSRKELKKSYLNFIFQPTYKPEYNTIEYLWGVMKKKKEKTVIKT